MTSKRKPRSTLQLPSASLRRHGNALAHTPKAQLQTFRAPSQKELAVAALVREDLAKQRGVAIKTEHAQGLAQVLALRSRARIVEFIDSSDELRSRTRPLEDQADVEAVDEFFRQYLLEAQVAILQGGVEQLLAIGASPLEPETEEVIEEQLPGLIGRLFGQKRTLIRR
jgi:hypothetical protein